MRQVDEQKSGTALVKLGTCGSHGRNDNKCCQHSSQSIKKCYPCSRCRDIFAVRKIRSVDQCTVACNRQGEKCLSKCEDPGGRLCQNFRLHAEDIAVSGSSSRLKGNIDAKDHKQYKEDRHHHFIGLFDAASNAVHQDKHADHKSSQLPEIISPGRGHASEFGAKGLNICRCQGRACKGSEHISEDPSHNNRITDSHGQCTDHRYPAQCFAQPSFASGFTGHAEGVNGPGTCPTAKAHLTDHSGKANECHENKIRDQERSPSIQGNSGGKHPDISHSNRRPDAGQNEPPAAVKRFSFFHINKISSLHLLVSV